MRDNEPFSFPLSGCRSLNDFQVNLPKNRIHFTYGGSGTLIVSFDNAGAPHREPRDRLPWGHKFFTGEGHSVLGVIAGASDWYRSVPLHAALEELKNDGFFRMFDKVVMTGSSMGGFAATAFAPLSPGCHVIAFNPQSTLHPDIVPWEQDHENGRKQVWSGSYSDGAVGVLSAYISYIIYDPFVSSDRRHAERFGSDNVSLLRAQFLGHGLPDTFLKLGILKEVMRQGIQGSLSSQWLHKSLRARRELKKYRKEVISAMARRGHVTSGLKFSRLAFRCDPDLYFRYYEAVFTAGAGKIDEAGAILEDSDKIKRRRRRRKLAAS